MPKVITVNAEAVLDAVLDHLEQHGILIPDWAVQFGPESFSEVVDVIEGMSITRPQTV